MDVTVERMKELRTSLAHQEDMIRATREKMNIEIAGMRGRTHELNARVDMLTRMLRSEYTDAIDSRISAMEQHSDDISEKLSDMNAGIDAQLASQSSRITMLAEDIALLQEEIRLMKNRLSELSSAVAGAELSERLSRIERSGDETELAAAAAKIKARYRYKA